MMCMGIFAPRHRENYGIDMKNGEVLIWDDWGQLLLSMHTCESDTIHDGHWSPTLSEVLFLETWLNSYTTVFHSKTTASLIITRDIVH